MHTLYAEAPLYHMSDLTAMAPGMRDNGEGQERLTARHSLSVFKDDHKKRFVP